ncbi:MAG: hypothetical protein M3P84_03870 [Chloroflexota bacterium]|nr:hypothetical protein [Chloroflexota bacterium]
MRFQDAARDGRAVVYAAIQAEPLVALAATLLVETGTPERVLARAVMNGERTDPAVWRRMFPGLFGDGVPAADRDRAEAVLAVSLEVADRGEQVRSQVRGAIVEALTERLIARRGPTVAAAVRRERRILFDGVATEIHPYDVTVEADGRAEAWDCKWGARGIGPDVLHQLDDARAHAVDEDEPLSVGLVIFDAELSCRVRLDRQTAPHDGTRLVAIEGLDDLAEPAGPAAGR